MPFAPRTTCRQLLCKVKDNPVLTLARVAQRLVELRPSHSYLYPTSTDFSLVESGLSDGVGLCRGYFMEGPPVR